MMVKLSTLTKMMKIYDSLKQTTNATHWYPNHFSMNMIIAMEIHVKESKSIATVFNSVHHGNK